jgi:activating signal cointegrator 1
VNPIQAPERTIPALTLWQPWASLIAIGAKPYETRSRPPPRRLMGQRVAIHAAARKPRHADLNGETHRAMCEAFGSGAWLLTLPLGVIVCTVVLADALPVERVTRDLFGDYSTGRWAWRLEDVRRVDPHVPAKGMQLWGWPWRVPEPFLGELRRLLPDAASAD